MLADQNDRHVGSRKVLFERVFDRFDGCVYCHGTTHQFQISCNELNDFNTLRVRRTHSHQIWWPFSVHGLAWRS